MLQTLASPAYIRLRSPQRVGRKLEPTVRDPRDTAKVFAGCGATNISSLQNALALNTTLFSDLGTVRNFYGHRNADTWRKVRVKGQAMGQFSAKHPNDLVTFIQHGRPVTVFEDWLDDADLFFEEASR